MRLVLLGPPGAGKGTQGDLLAKRLGVPAISTGSLLRAEAAARTTLGLAAKPHLDGGTLVPDAVSAGVVAGRLGLADVAAGFILDGFPRNVPQARALAQMAGGRELDVVLEFRLSREEVVRRLSGRRTCPSCDRSHHVDFDPAPEGRCGTCGAELIQRADDVLEVIEERLDVYEVQTRPVVAHYRAADLLVTVDAGDTVEAVHAKALAAIR